MTVENEAPADKLARARQLVRWADTGKNPQETNMLICALHEILLVLETMDENQ